MLIREEEPLPARFGFQRRAWLSATMTPPTERREARSSALHRLFRRLFSHSEQHLLQDFRNTGVNSSNGSTENNSFPSN